MAFTYSAAAARMAGQDASRPSLEDLFCNYKCKQSFAILYLDKKKSNLIDMPLVLRKLELNTDDVIGVQRDTEKWFTRVIIKLKEEALDEFDRMVSMDGEVFTIQRTDGEEVRIMVQDMASNIKYVSVAGVPFEVPDEALYNLMSRFGDVKGVRMNYYHTILPGIATGTRVVKMNIKKSIPSVIKVGNKTLNIYYSGQAKTCSKCGMEGHLGSDCETPEEERTHLINDTDYPILIQQQGEEGRGEGEAAGASAGASAGAAPASVIAALAPAAASPAPDAPVAGPVVTDAPIEAPKVASVVETLLSKPTTSAIAEPHEQHTQVEVTPLENDSVMDEKTMEHQEFDPLSSREEQIIHEEQTLVEKEMGNLSVASQPSQLGVQYKTVFKIAGPGNVPLEGKTTTSFAQANVGDLSRVGNSEKNRQ